MEWGSPKASFAFASKSCAMLLFGEILKISSHPCFTFSKSPLTNQVWICFKAFSSGLAPGFEEDVVSSMA
jgi:hypothetical protein